MPSVSTENYLKALYHLQRDQGRVSTSALARRLDVTLPSATKMMKSLHGSGWVDHQPYRGTRLTEDGERAALTVIRKHRLVECFLVEVLGYDWDEVHDEAEGLEHAVSDVLADRIDAYLGFPARDPHGDPIPTAAGAVSRPDAPALSELAVGDRGTILRVLDQDTEVLRHLASLGVRPGVAFEVMEVMPFDGPLRLRIDGEDRLVVRSLARRVLATQ